MGPMNHPSEFVQNCVKTFTLQSNVVLKMLTFIFGMRNIEHHLFYLDSTPDGVVSR